MVDLTNSLRAVKPFIAIEWPKNCTYWKLEKVIQFCELHHLCPVSFDGCMLGVVDKHQMPIRKPWTVQTNLVHINELFNGLVCDGSHEHAEGRGESLKRTEDYTFRMTDLIHQAFSMSVTRCN